MAIEELAFKEDKRNFKLIYEKEVSNHKLVYEGESLPVDKSDKVFAIEVVAKNKIFIYQFNNTGIYKRIECDSNWIVRTINYLGDVD